MDLTYIDLYANNLNLNIIEGYLEKSNLSIFLEDQLEVETIKIEAGIIGASHYITVNFNNKAIVNEIFACIKLESAKHRLNFLKNENKISFNQYLKNLNIKYSFYSYIEDIKDNSISKISSFSEKIRKASKNKFQLGLSFTFPNKEKHYLEAKTEVLIYIKENIIFAETIHIYPNENKYVYSKSSFSYTKEL